jgi:hypothetical protein
LLGLVRLDGEVRCAVGTRETKADVNQDSQQQYGAHILP